ncbi:alpha/beta hydrolase family protein [Streptomyces sp. NRRL F-2664]|uniref:alpha/beta hydrolase family protein n=1 Tax=Streptomyces sp. NRRL F-2664 TaxID=1463842 RepID=UPI0004C67E93|nr:CocE/NonD family hydrolase [Streptomyces sp. NRRL F-2664]
MAAVLAVLALAAAGLGTLIVRQNTYALREETVTVRHGGRALDGVLALPERGRGPFPLVVFVHGDGPVDATHETFYRPLWESFARAGYASLSWSKPGVGGSPGNWLDQSMDDRAGEVADAIAWARQRPEVDAGRIGLWGASQAGWVLPKVAAADPRIRFVIAVSPAIDWRRQGRYNLLAELRRDGASDAEAAAALRRRDTVLDLLARGAPYEEYVQAVGDAPDMSAERWRFVSRNHTADASVDLPALRGLPVLLVLAGHDLNVDVTETEAVYRQVLPGPALHVAHYPDATHALVRRSVEASTVRLTLTAVCAPRSLFADGFLADQRTFLASLGDAAPPS